MDEIAATAAPVARSIGERLRAGRERAGLSIAATAEKLHLDNKVIESLEADRFSELGASVFVRGHLRRYADFVGEPGIELVELYEKSRAARPPAPDLTQAPQPGRKVDPRRLVIAVGIASAAVVAAAIWWIVSRSPLPADESGSAATTAEVPAAAPSNDDIIAVPDATVLAGMQSTAPAAAVSTPAATQAARVAPATAADAPKPEAPARGTQLTLRVASESWVEVYDATGKQLYFDVAGGGTVQSVEGRPPLRVMLGNAAGVSVEVDGKSRDIPEAAIDGEGARFVVNRSGSLSRSR